MGRGGIGRRAGIKLQFFRVGFESLRPTKTEDQMAEEFKPIPTEEMFERLMQDPKFREAYEKAEQEDLYSDPVFPPLDGDVGK